MTAHFSWDPEYMTIFWCPSRRRKWSANWVGSIYFYTGLTPLTHPWHVTPYSFFHHPWQSQIHRSIPLSHQSLHAVHRFSQLLTPTCVGKQDPALGEIPACDPKRVPPQLSWRAEICLSFMKTSSSESPLSHQEKKELWGGEGLLSTCAEE